MKKLQLPLTSYLGLQWAIARLNDQFKYGPTWTDDEIYEEYYKISDAVHKANFTDEKHMILDECFDLLNINYHEYLNAEEVLS